MANADAWLHESRSVFIQTDAGRLLSDSSTPRSRLGGVVTMSCQITCEQKMLGYDPKQLVPLARDMPVSQIRCNHACSCEELSEEVLRVWDISA